MDTLPRSGADYRLVAALFGVLLLINSGLAISQGYTPLPAQPGSSGYFSEATEALTLSFGPQQSDHKPGRPLQKDAHTDTRDYNRRNCTNCHADLGENLHSMRANVTCRQCHGFEPIASINHYYSAMNPIRRHAYVCAKCHEGANASFASYVIHPPKAARAREVLASFPALYWTDWFMFILILGVFIVFIPHSIGWWIREWFVKRKNNDEEE